ncbi:MAG: hypothetical protein WCL71_06680 [Deltaproteobacteria bacterium]
MRKQWLIFFALFALFAVPRLVYVVVVGECSEVMEVERAALSLSRTGILGNILADDSRPSAHVMPLYPLVRAAFYRVFGVEVVRDLHLLEFLIVAVGASYVGFLPFVACRAGLTRGAGILAGIAMALMPTFIWIESGGGGGSVLTTALFVAVFWIILVLHDCGWTRWDLCVALGMGIGTAILLDPLLLLPITLAVVGDLFFQRHSWRMLCRRLLVIGTLVALFWIPWTVRNYRGLGAFVPLRSNFGLELWIGNNPRATGLTDITYWNDPSSYANQLHPTASGEALRGGEAAYMHEKLVMAVQWIRSNPRQFVKLVAARARYYWMPSRDLLSPTTRWAGVKTAITCMIGGVGLCGLLAVMVRRHPYRWFFAAALFGVSSIYMLTHVCNRYRYPAQWLLCLLGADLLLWAVFKVRTRWQRAC